MIRCLQSGLVCLLFVLSLSHAAQAENKPNVISGETGWESSVTDNGGTVSGTFSESESAAIEKVSAYFNELTTLKGRFEQTDPDQSAQTGTVYVAKPGRFRFEYSRPSRKVVISDGRFLAVQDRDLRTEETYELDSTPFRILLSDDVNLLRDAQVLQIQDGDGQISLVLRDKDPDVPAAIKVVVTTDPEMALRGWITRDAQGLETRVELTSVQHGVDLDKDLFVREKFFGNAFQSD